MRAIDNMVKTAIINKSYMSKQNTIATFADPISKNNVSIYLHGHLIFSFNYETKKFSWNDCGYATSITQSRLNACFSAIKEMHPSIKFKYIRKNNFGKVVQIND